MNYRIKKKTTLKITEYKAGMFHSIYFNVYKVQKRWFGLWITIKTFSGKNDNWWAKACAMNLLDELNKEQ